MPDITDLLFYGFAGLALLFGFLCVANPISRSPVTSAMFLVLTIVSLAGLFILLHAFFLAAIQVLVYAGAVMVLFLFGVVLVSIAGWLLYEQKLDGAAILGISLIVSGVLVLNLFSKSAAH